MVNVNIKFNGKDYLLSCDEGQEDGLKELANYLDTKYDELKSNLGNIGENKLLLITAIKIIDEFFDIKKVKFSVSLVDAPGNRSSHQCRFARVCTVFFVKIYTKFYTKFTRSHFAIYTKSKVQSYVPKC